MACCAELVDSTEPQMNAVRPANERTPLLRQCCQYAGGIFAVHRRFEHPRFQANGPF